MQFLITAVSEAEQVLSDVQTSLEEQKELLAVSACQQEMVNYYMFWIQIVLLSRLFVAEK